MLPFSKATNISRLNQVSLMERKQDNLYLIHLSFDYKLIISIAYSAIKKQNLLRLVRTTISTLDERVRS